MTKKITKGLESVLECEKRNTVVPIFERTMTRISELFIPNHTSGTSSFESSIATGKLRANGAT